VSEPLGLISEGALRDRRQAESCSLGATVSRRSARRRQAVARHSRGSHPRATQWRRAAVNLARRKLREPRVVASASLIRRPAWNSNTALSRLGSQFSDPNYTRALVARTRIFGLSEPWTHSGIRYYQCGSKFRSREGLYFVGPRSLFLCRGRSCRN